MGHWLLHFLGLDSASGTAYLAWSGTLSDLGELTLIGGLLAVYRKHQCHAARCFRLGHHDFTDPATKVTYRLCRKCDPRHPGSRPLTRHHIARIHAESLERLVRPGRKGAR